MIEQSDIEEFLLGPAPFGAAFLALMDGYFRCAPMLMAASSANAGKVDWTNPELTRSINSNFTRFISGETNHRDPHLSDGPFGSLRIRDPDDSAPPYDTRASLLLKRDFQRSSAIQRNLQRFISRKRRAVGSKSDVLFSPLLFLRQMLTAPSYLASEAYAHAVIRAFLFAAALKARGSFVSERDRSEPRNAYDYIRSALDFRQVSRSVQKLASHVVGRDNVQVRTPTDFVVYHMLASKGILVCRFRPEDPAFDERRKNWASLSEFLGSGDFGEGVGFCEFRVAPEIRKIPTAAEVANELDGLPIPIPGADIVFQGGLRFTQQSGLVARVTGKAGTGKTSLGLGVALSLAPLGTRTFYISCEEQEGDLLHRIRTLVPTFIARTASWQDPSRWFTGVHVSGDAVEKREEVFSALERLVSEHRRSMPQPETCPPGLMPLLIILDGVHEIFDQEPSLGSRSQSMRDLISRCQDTGALVLAMSANTDRTDLSALDYLVDVVVELNYAKSLSEADPPARRLDLIKTRRQTSRTGSHLLHLAGTDGLSISPQLGAQLDHHSLWRWVEPDLTNCFDFLRRTAEQGPGSPSTSLVRIFERSQILVNGEGSSGKSLIGLRILLAQLIPAHRAPTSGTRRSREGAQAQMQLDMPEARARVSVPQPYGPDDLVQAWYEQLDPARRRILVVSFLYQESYYLRTMRYTRRYWKEDTAFPKIMPEPFVEVISFPAGFMRPEDLIVEITGRLKSAEAEGFPFEGILLDGVHNVYLQFPYLEASEMVWPTLYELLRSRGLTVVTTHTHFSMGEISPAVTDVEAARRRVGPLLHALVQATDIVLRVSPPQKADLARRGAHPLFRIDVPSSIDLDASGGALLWDREHGVVVRPASI